MRLCRPAWLSARTLTRFSYVSAVHPIYRRHPRRRQDRTHKQRPTAIRILARLRDEHGFTGGYTIVREYVNGMALRNKEMFVPLAHRPGHAQVDFGEADGYIG